MKPGGPLFAVRDMKTSLEFYRDVLGLEVVNDFGANVVLTGGLSLQTLETWADFLDKAPEDIRFAVCGAGPRAAGAPLGPAGGAAVRPGPPHH